MAFEFKLPDIGEGVTEGEIVKWLVKAGDTVKEDQPIVEVMTDKATVEIASPKSGTIESLLAKDGDMIQVGKGLVMINESGTSASKSDSKSEPAKEAAPAQGSKAQAADETAAKKPATEQTKSPEGDQRPQASNSAPTKSAPAAQPMQASSNGSSNASSVLASPATRKMAREHGLDLASIQGSGDLGRVTREDVEKSMGAPKAMGATSAGAPSAAPSAPMQLLNIPRAAAVSNSKHEERIPVRGIRKKIVENMRLSVDHAAHFTHMDEFDATNLVNVRNELKGEAEKYGVKLNYLPFLVKAVCMALKKYPRLNGTFDEEKNEIVIKHYYNMGVAVATKDGDLVVPVIQNADQKNILEISSEIKDLANKAQTNKFAPTDFANGTFTITSLGPVAGTYATPIINYPELGILGFFAIKERPVVKDGQIVIRHMGSLAISLDHRIVDGYMGAQFTKQLIEYLENPTSLLLFTA